jgi:hypothetical protein
MFKRWKKSQHLPISSYLENRSVRGRETSRIFTKLNPRKSGRTLPQALLFTFAVVVTATGVMASVAITLRGNSSTRDGVVSLGVGQAAATSCNTGTTVKTDTISQWDDTYGDFTLQTVEVTGVLPSCENNVMTLVLNMSSGPDVNVTCNLPASTSVTYSQATFVFATSAFSTDGNRWSCGTFPGYPKYMASISAAAVQIK